MTAKRIRQWLHRKHWQKLSQWLGIQTVPSTPPQTALLPYRDSLMSNKSGSRPTSVSAAAQTMAPCLSGSLSMKLASSDFCTISSLSNWLGNTKRVPKLVWKTGRHTYIPHTSYGCISLSSSENYARWDHPTLLFPHTQRAHLAISKTVIESCSFCNLVVVRYVSSTYAEKSLSFSNKQSQTKQPNKQAQFSLFLALSLQYKSLNTLR